MSSGAGRIRREDDSLAEAVVGRFFSVLRETEVLPVQEEVRELTVRTIAPVLTTTLSLKRGFDVNTKSLEVTSSLFHERNRFTLVRLWSNRQTHAIFYFFAFRSKQLLATYTIKMPQAPSGLRLEGFERNLHVLASHRDD